MPKRTHHAVYDLKYHLVWIPKYRKFLLLGSIEKRIKDPRAMQTTKHIHTVEVMSCSTGAENINT